MVKKIEKIGPRLYLRSAAFNVAPLEIKKKNFVTQSPFVVDLAQKIFGHSQMMHWHKLYTFDPYAPLTSVSSEITTYTNTKTCHII